MCPAARGYVRRRTHATSLRGATGESDRRCRRRRLRSLQDADRHRCLRSSVPFTGDPGSSSTQRFSSSFVYSAFGRALQMSISEHAAKRKCVESRARYQAVTAPCGGVDALVRQRRGSSEGRFRPEGSIRGSIPAATDSSDINSSNSQAVLPRNPTRISVEVPRVLPHPSGRLELQQARPRLAGMTARPTG
jgi:hypothetical protein